MTELLKLAERVEAAEAETKELFLEAWDAALGFNARSIRSGSLYQRFLACMDIGAWLDAAMTLVPEGWARVTDNTTGTEIVELYTPSDALDEGIERAANKSLALALCAAALRARASS